MHLKKSQILGAAPAAILVASGALAVTVGPEFFGYSKPFFGGQVLLISKNRCAAPVRGIDPDLLAKHEATSRAPSSQVWLKSEGHSTYGIMPGCWVEVVKLKEPAIMNCNLVDGALQKDQCVVLAKSMFLDTGELPPEPPPKRPAKF
jgi:hypothetical protein